MTMRSRRSIAQQSVLQTSTMPTKRLLVLTFTALIGLTSPAMADTITVAVAANVQFAFDELRMEFKKESGHDIQPVYSSSGKLAAQIMNDAPFDVFLSA